MLEAGHEQRADRAVNESRGQGLFLGRAAFTLEVAAGDAARCVVFFLIVDGQREEVLAGLGDFAKTAVARTVVSPYVAITAPSA
jgi:hypothetical protein